jgi:Tol biopolymer transport system component
MRNDTQHLTRPSNRRAFAAAAAAAALAAALLVAADHARATAPGQNGRIVFRRYLDVAKTTSAIFTVRPNGTHERQLTRPPARSDDRRPDYAPDGQAIAFERKTPCPAGGPEDGLNNTCDLVYTVKANGTRLRSLVPCGFDAAAPFPGNCVGEDDPAWSPDGSQIAFQYNLADHAYTGSLGLDAGIWIVNRDGTGLRQVTERTPATYWDFGAQWSPDGRELAFVRSDLSTGADAIFTVDTDGTDEHQVTPWALNGGDRTDWSPDGRWILFRVQAGDGSSNLYEVHPDGSAVTNLTNQPAGGYQYLSPSFSPDGTQIVSARTPGAGPEGAADIVVMNADGSNAHPITDTRLWESAADWGPRPHG